MKALAPKEKTYRIKATQKELTMVVNNSDPNIPTPAALLEREKTHPFRLGKCEVERSARILVQFFAETENGSWRYFSLEELSSYCIEKGHKNAGAALFGLICGWVDDCGLYLLREPWPYIVQLNEEAYCVTSLFIKRLVTTP